MQDQIGESAYRAQQAIESGRRGIVGVNVFADAGDGVAIPIQHIDPAIEPIRSSARAPFARARDAARADARWTRSGAPPKGPPT